MEKLLSVIVPVYKVEKYISECLESLSVPESSRHLYEVLVINDSTPDSSAEIARTFQDKYPSVFKVIDKENGGHGSVWNLGLSICSGKYVLFLDSDDYVINFEKLLSFLDNTDADLVMTDKVVFIDGTDKSKKTSISGIAPGKVFSLDEKAWPCRGNGFYNAHFHSCVYKAEVLRPFAPLFIEKSYYDDIMLFVAPLVGGTTYVYTGFTLYHYRLGRAGQTMDNSVVRKNMAMQVMQRKHALGFVEEHPVASGPRKVLLDQVVRCLCKIFCDFIYKLPSEEGRPMLEEWISFVKEHVGSWGKIPEISLYGKLPYPIYRLAIKSKNAIVRLLRLVS